MERQFTDNLTINKAMNIQKEAEQLFQSIVIFNSGGLNYKDPFSYEKEVIKLIYQSYKEVCKAQRKIDVKMLGGDVPILPPLLTDKPNKVGYPQDYAPTERVIFESDLDSLLKEAFNRGYASGIFHDVDNPKAHSQRNKAYKDWNDQLNKQDSAIRRPAKKHK